ncbi:hypothetical protein [Pseudomonas fluorescens]|nr:hypothetical protein [Pseudomonas fluorescens]
MTVHSFDFIGVPEGFNGRPDQKLNAQGIAPSPVGAKPGSDGIPSMVVS